MNGAGKGKSCRGEGDLRLLLLFAEYKSEGHGWQLGWRTRLAVRLTTDRETASLWRDLMVVLYSVVEITPFDKYGATRRKNWDWRVSFILTSPPYGEATTLWEGLQGWRVLASIISSIIRKGYPRREAFWFPRADDRWKSSSRSRWLREGQSFG